MFFYGRIVIPFHSLSSKSINFERFTHSAFKRVLSFPMISSIAATTIKVIRNTRTLENRSFIFECEQIDQLALTLEYNSKIAVGDTIFHYMINSSANLKQKLT